MATRENLEQEILYYRCVRAMNSVWGNEEVCKRGLRLDVCLEEHSRQIEPSGEDSLRDTWKIEKTEPLETKAGKVSKARPGDNTRSLTVKSLKWTL